MIAPVVQPVHSRPAIHKPDRSQLRNKRPNLAHPVSRDLDCLVIHPRQIAIGFVLSGPPPQVDEAKEGPIPAAPHKFDRFRVGCEASRQPEISVQNSLLFLSDKRDQPPVAFPVNLLYSVDMPLWNAGKYKTGRPFNHHVYLAAMTIVFPIPAGELQPPARINVS
jgi:hypothetical protein